MKPLLMRSLAGPVAPLSVFFVVFLAVQVFWAVTVSVALAQDTSKSPLVVMGDKDYPPYESLVDGKPSGVNVDLWREIAKVLGRPLDLRLYQWADSQARVRRGEAKVLTFMSSNKERDKLYDFTKPTFTSRFPIFVPAGIADKFDVSDLTGKRIALKKGGFPRTIIETIHPEAVMVFVDSALEGFRKLLRGEVDGVMEDERVGYTILSENAFHGIRATPKALAVKTGHIAVVKGNPALLRQIDKALKELKATGKFDQIADKWAGLDTIQIEKETIIFIVVSGLAAIVLILGLGGVVYVLKVRRANLVLRKEITERKKAEEELRLSEERLRHIVDSSPFGVSIVSLPNRKRLYVNHHFVEMLGGRSDEEILKWPAAESYSDPSKREQNWAAFERDGILISTEEQRKRLDGTTWWCLTDWRPIVFEGKEAMINWHYDITEIKQMNEELRLSEDRLRRAVHDAPIPVIMHAEDGEVLMISNKWVELSGYSLSDIPTLYDWTEKAYGTDKKHMKRQRKVIKALYELKEPGEHEAYITTASGEKRTWQVHDAPLGRLPDGRRFIISMALDITERKQAGEARQAALADAEQANQAKSEFLAAMSHDLRTPLNAILGFADILSHQYFGPIGDKNREYAADIHSSGEHLLTLVNDILDLSAIEAGKQSLVKEKLSTMEIVRECKRIVEGKARSNGIDLITELPKDLPPLYADKRAFKQILLNLLSNAVKFTPEGGKITVSAKALKRSTTLKVADTGKGIPAENLPKLTDPFARADTDPYLTEQGWGLGLTITKSLIDLHDGKLDIKSKVGKGTTVTVTLPNGAP